MLRPPPTVAVSGKKRALPTWAGGSVAASGAPAPAKKASPPKAAASFSFSSSSPAAASPSLFTPSYTPSPQSSASKAATAAAPAPAAPSSSTSTRVFTQSPQSASSAPKAALGAAVAGGPASPPTATGRLFTPSYTVAPAPAVVDLSETSPEPWTSEVVLRLIKEAGPPGATFEVIDAVRRDLTPVSMRKDYRDSSGRFFHECFYLHKMRLQIHLLHHTPCYFFRHALSSGSWTLGSPGVLSSCPDMTDGSRTTIVTVRAGGESSI